MSNPNNTIARTVVNGYTITTVKRSEYLSLHDNNKYETMVFPPHGSGGVNYSDLAEYVWPGRNFQYYDNTQSALEGHRAMVAAWAFVPNIPTLLS